MPMIDIPDPLPPAITRPAQTSSSSPTSTWTNSATPARLPAPGTGSCTETDLGLSVTWTGRRPTATGRLPRYPPTDWPDNTGLWRLCRTAKQDADLPFWNAVH
jgi:hypothetical protein